MAGIDTQMVADHLGVAVDDRLGKATAAACRWTEKRRSLTDPVDLWLEPDVILGTVLYAALLYQSRAQPQGFPGMDNLGSYSEDTGQAMVNIYRLVGNDAVIA